MKKFCTAPVCVLLSIIMLLSCIGCSKRTTDIKGGDEPSAPSTDSGAQDTDNSGADSSDVPEDTPNADEGNNDSASKPNFPSFSTGAVVNYNFSESGTIRSDTGTKLNLYINWSATSKNGKVLKVKFTVGIESYSIQVGARQNLGKFKLNGKSYTYSTDALTIADNRKKVNTDFYTFEEEYEFTKGETLTFDVVASWVFNGVYGGTPLETLVAGDTVRLNMPK